MNKRQITNILRRPPHLPIIPKLRPERIIESILDHHPEYSEKEQEKVTIKIQKAVGVATSAHSGFIRKSGEPYIIHPFTVAFYLAEIGMDVDAVVAGLLHDTVEDTSTTVAEIKKMFGTAVATLVDAVTKLHDIPLNREEKQAHAFQKILTFAADDIRVIFIKLLDRLHNMNTLDAMPEKSRERISNETLRYYAPLAHRLGLFWLKEELEAFGFYFLMPKEWKEIDSFITRYFQDVNKVLVTLKKQVVNAIEVHNRDESNTPITRYTVIGRVKSYYGIFLKTSQEGSSYASLHDLLGIRIIIEDADCYAVMGILHSYSEFHHISNRFKDYIARPKENGYRSIHTGLSYKNYFFEAQIRTKEMHQISENGYATSHMLYKEDGSSKDKHTRWVHDILKDLAESDDPIIFMRDIENNLTVDKISVFTPKGELVTLSKKATLLDFAYAIHSDIGSHCVGGIVNGTKRPLVYQLHNRDSVDIDTVKTQQPSLDWLEIAVTTRAKSHIRKFLKQQNRDVFIQQGRTMIKLLFATLNRVSICEKFESDPLFAKLKDTFSLPHDAALDSFCYQVAIGEIKFRRVIKLLFSYDDIIILSKAFPDRVGKLFPELMPEKKVKEKPQTKDLAPIYINGIGELKEYAVAKCCAPLEGDFVSAYISPTRGYTLHKTKCPSLARLDQKRVEHDIFWYHYTLYTIDIVIELVNAVGAMQDVIKEMTLQEFNIDSLYLNSDHPKTETGLLYVTFKGTNLDAVDDLQKSLKKKKQKKILNFTITSISQK
ncbi:bifunctional (p)ppGpp synthetase/guanosine-3',5'-bis(diphosphate) 3'-pyrophosphohydrolase [bacterium]|nr:bifunctional (p)ppGpp synthetase/guanosine-3',5'-bis(diphosphate) 3'-pyrophosphohydrolase [bacterium]